MWPRLHYLTLEGTSALFTFHCLSVTLALSNFLVFIVYLLLAGYVWVSSSFYTSGTCLLYPVALPSFLLSMACVRKCLLPCVLAAGPCHFAPPLPNWCIDIVIQVATASPLLVLPLCWFCHPQFSADLHLQGPFQTSWPLKEFGWTGAR